MSSLAVAILQERWTKATTSHATVDAAPRDWVQKLAADPRIVEAAEHPDFEERLEEEVRQQARVAVPERMAERNAERHHHGDEHEEQSVQRLLERRARVAERARLAG